MPLLPLPFLTAVVLVSLLAYAGLSHGLRLPPLAVATIAGYALQAALIGAKWGPRDVGTLPLLSVATILPPLTWVTLNDLCGKLSRLAKPLVLGLILVLLLAIKLLVALHRGELLDLISTPPRPGRLTG